MGTKVLGFGLFLIKTLFFLDMFLKGIAKINFARFEKMFWLPRWVVLIVKKGITKKWMVWYFLSFLFFCLKSIKVIMFVW